MVKSITEKTQHLSLNEMLKWCCQELCDSSDLARKVKNLVKRGRIKSTQPRGYNTTIYLPLKSQKMVENIFRHVRDMKRADIPVGLVDASTAARSIGVNPTTINYLLNQYGVEFSLTEDIKIPDSLSIRPGGRYGYEPRVPFVKWVGLVTDAPRFLTTPIINCLKRYSPKIEKKERRSWARNLIDFIRADEEQRERCLYFQK